MEEERTFEAYFFQRRYELEGTPEPGAERVDTSLRRSSRRFFSGSGCAAG